MAKKKTTASKASPVSEVVAPLAAASAWLAATMNEIDNADDITKAMELRFNHDVLTQKDMVNQVIVGRADLEGQEESYLAISQYWAARAARVAHIRKLIDDRILELIKQSEGVPFKGDLGSLAIKYNPPSLKTVWGGNVIDEKIIEMFGVEEEFYEVIPPPPPPEPKTTYKLKTNDVKKAIKEGRELEWATTERGEKLEVK